MGIGLTKLAHNENGEVCEFKRQIYVRSNTIYKYESIYSSNHCKSEFTQSYDLLYKEEKRLEFYRLMNAKHWIYIKKDYLLVSYAPIKSILVIDKGWL